MLLHPIVHCLNWKGMNVWQFMEMIHSRSYTYIIKNVYPNPAEVFDTILDDEKILKRANSVTAPTTTLLMMPKSMGRDVCGKKTGKIHLHHSGQFMNSKENSIEQSQMSISWKELGSMSPSRACFWRLCLWKDRQKSLCISRDENQHLVLTQNILKNWMNVMIQR